MKTIRAITIVVLVNLLMSCAYSIDVPGDKSLLTITTAKRPIVAVLASAKEVRGDEISSLSQSKKDALKYVIRDTKIFQKVTDIPREHEKTVRFNYVIKRNTPKTNVGALKGKIILAGLSMGLFWPFLHEYWNYEETITLEVVRWDGTTKNYERTVTGSGYWTLGHTLGLKKLQEEVHRRCLNTIFNDVVRDKDFF